MTATIGVSMIPGTALMRRALLLVDRELVPPEEWAADEDRSRGATVPERLVSAHHSGYADPRGAGRSTRARRKNPGGQVPLSVPELRRLLTHLLWRG
jgi:hypothetical protein